MILQSHGQIFNLKLMHLPQNAKLDGPLPSLMPLRCVCVFVCGCFSPLSGRQKVRKAALWHMGGLRALDLSQRSWLG